jgi:hypothetical protein
MCNDDDDDVQVSQSVTNLIYLIDELALNQLELIDLSAALYYRMEAEEVRDEE